MSDALLSGRGVLLQRGIAFDPDTVLCFLDHPRFDHDFSRWLRTGENFLLYAVSDSGQHFSYESSLRSVMQERFDEVLSMFEARAKKLNCMIHADVSMAKAVFAKADAHLAKPAQIKARDVAAQPPVMTHSGTHPLFGRVRIFEVSKAAVLEMDVASFLDAFDQLSASQDLLESNWMQLRLAFDGWDDDKRESYQIPEIREFIKAVVAGAPWWIALVHPSDYVLWFACIEDFQFVEVGADAALTLQFKPMALEAAANLAASEAGHFVAISGIEDAEIFGSMTVDLGIAISKLLSGVNLPRADPLAFMSIKPV